MTVVEQFTDVIESWRQ